MHSDNELPLFHEGWQSKFISMMHDQLWFIKLNIILWSSRISKNMFWSKQQNISQLIHLFFKKKKKTTIKKQSKCEYVLTPPPAEQYT